MGSRWATGARRLVGARPVEHGCESYFGTKRKIQPLSGSRGLFPLMLPPPLGERGGPPRNFHAISKKLGRDFP